MDFEDNFLFGSYSEMGYSLREAHLIKDELEVNKIMYPHAEEYFPAKRKARDIEESLYFPVECMTGKKDTFTIGKQIVSRLGELDVPYYPSHGHAQDQHVPGEDTHRSTMACYCSQQLSSRQYSARTSAETIFNLMFEELENVETPTLL